MHKDHVESTRQWEEIDRLEKIKQEKRVVHSHLLYRDNIRSILVHQQVASWRIIGMNLQEKNLSLIKILHIKRQHIHTEASISWNWAFLG